MYLYNLDGTCCLRIVKYQYCDALQKLAKSMQRTGVFQRQVVMHQHMMLMPKQIFALEIGKRAAPSGCHHRVAAAGII
jgi:hypothetical protein